MLVHFQSVPPFSSTSRGPSLILSLFSFFFFPFSFLFPFLSFYSNDISNTYHLIILNSPLYGTVIVLHLKCILPTWCLLTANKPRVFLFSPQSSSTLRFLASANNTRRLLKTPRVFSPDYFYSARSDLSMRARQSLRPPALYRPPSISCHSHLPESYCASL